MLVADFGFAKHPFGATPDPGAVFCHGALRKVCADLLAAHLSRRRGLFLITGEPGVGKSALLSKLLAERQIARSCVYLSCRTGPSFEALVDSWCRALALAGEHDGHKTKYRALVVALSRQLDAGGSSALLLDDAENLGKAAVNRLRRLAEREQDARPLVQIVLAARPEDGGPDAGSRTIAFSTELAPVSPIEVGGYVHCRLEAAGYDGPPLFAPEAIQRIARVTRGNPRRIDGLCQTALSVAAAAEQRVVSAVMVEQAFQEAPTDGTGAALPPANPSSGAGPGQPAPSPGGVWPLPFAAVPPPSAEARHDPVRAGRVDGRSPWRHGIRFAAGLMVGLIIGAAALSILQSYGGPGYRLSFDLLLSPDDEKLDFAAAPALDTAPAVRQAAVAGNGPEAPASLPPEILGEKQIAPPWDDRFVAWLRDLIARLGPTAEPPAETPQGAER
jgi:type II secretory pathway predicted ATPase ExeA